MPNSFMRTEMLKILISSSKKLIDKSTKLLYYILYANHCAKNSNKSYFCVGYRTKVLPCVLNDSLASSLHLPLQFLYWLHKKRSPFNPLSSNKSKGLRHEPLLS